MTGGSIDGFDRRRLPGDGITLDVLVGGSGPPLLLLHGFPQTRVMWRSVASRLTDRYTVVVPDLRGYGRSDKPHGDAEHVTYAKRTLALDQVSVMRALGFDRFAVAGHDRGGRVAYRLALDHPDVITRLAVLDILPTHHTWANATAEAAMAGYHWYLLAQPEPIPETLIGGHPRFFLESCLQRWAAPGFVFDDAELSDYVACFSDPSSIHAACEDYRSGWTQDRAADAQDREASRTIACPTLVLWGDLSPAARTDPVGAWQDWCADVRGRSVPSGHFIPEEAPDETIAAFLHHFG